MARLMEYMYTGATEARREELPDILNTATRLQIRGFGLTRSTNEKTEENNDSKDQKNIPAGRSLHKKIMQNKTVKKLCGRKSSVPKKLQLPQTETNSSDNSLLPVTPLVDKKKFPILGSYLNSFKQGTKGLFYT